MANKVFVGVSLDGFLADKDGGLDFLDSVPNPNGDDLGYNLFMESVDAVLMGRKTFEVVLGFNIPWPYTKPVFVMSSSMKGVPDKLTDKVEVVSGELNTIVNELGARGYTDLYIDGGKLIQSFMAEDMIDDLIVTSIPIVLGGGAPLYGDLATHQAYILVKNEVLLNELVQSHYKRKV